MVRAWLQPVLTARVQEDGRAAAAAAGDASFRCQQLFDPTQIIKSTTTQETAYKSARLIALSSGRAGYEAKLGEPAGSAHLIKLTSHRVSSARLRYEIEWLV